MRGDMYVSYVTDITYDMNMGEHATIGPTGLRERMAEVLREVEMLGYEYEIRSRGRVVAMLIPVAMYEELAELRDR